MTKKNLFKIIAIAFLLFLLVGLLFFRKGDDEILNPNPAPADNQQAENPDEKYEFIKTNPCQKYEEENEIEKLSKDIVEKYGTYKIGDYYNLEEIKQFASNSFKEKLERKINNIKSNSANVIRLNNISTNAIEAKTLSFSVDEERKSEVLVVVDESHSASESAIEDHSADFSVFKIYILDFVKENDIWKLDNIRVQ